MSAPDTNIDKQASRHRGPLIGIAAVLVFVGLMTVGYIVWYGATPEDAAAKNDPTVTATEQEATSAGATAQPAAND